MKTLQRAGGVGALVLAVTFVLLILSNAVIQPSLGIAGDAGTDPAKLAPVASAARLIFGLPILFAVAFVLVTLGLSDRLQERSPGLMRIASASGVGAAVLFLAAGMFAFNLVPVVASHSSLTTSQVALVVAVEEGLLSAAIFAAGWFVLLASWTAMRGGLPQFLSYLGLLFGVLSVLAFIIPPLQILGGFVGIVWALWTGIVLWQS